MYSASRIGLRLLGDMKPSIAFWVVLFYYLWGVARDFGPREYGFEVWFRDTLNPKPKHLGCRPSSVGLGAQGFLAQLI